MNKNETGFILPNYTKEQILSVLTTDDIVAGMMAFSDLSEKEARTILEKERRGE